MAKKQTPPPMPELQAAVLRLTPAQREAVHRLAKDPKRGLRPFFCNPHAMILLRNSIQHGK